MFHSTTFKAKSQNSQKKKYTVEATPQYVAEPNGNLEAGT